MRIRDGDAFVHFVNRDKRLDFWMPEADLPEPVAGDVDKLTSRKRKRISSVSVSATASGSGPQTSEATPPLESQTPASVAAPPARRRAERKSLQPETRPPVEMTEEEIDIREHRKITTNRNFDKVNFGRWQIKTWYDPVYSSYCGATSRKRQLRRAHNAGTSLLIRFRARKRMKWSRLPPRTSYLRRRYTM